MTRLQLWPVMIVVFFIYTFILYQHNPGHGTKKTILWWLLQWHFQQLILNQSWSRHHISRVMRKPAYCICENKDADQLCSNRKADQPLCFRFIHRIIPLLPKSKISSLQPSSVIAQPIFCQTWMDTQKSGFLLTRLKWILVTAPYRQQSGAYLTVSEETILPFLPEICEMPIATQE